MRMRMRNARTCGGLVLFPQQEVEVPGDVPEDIARSWIEVGDADEVRPGPRDDSPMAPSAPTKE